MFELNKNLEIKEELFNGSIIYTIDNFYRYPQQLEKYLFRDISSLPFHKGDEKPSYNGTYFEDRRHPARNSLQLKKVYDFLSDLCGQEYDSHDIATNCARFKRHEFNDYENCHWWPHTDTGYNGIVYFNDDNENGTNFYNELKPLPEVNEHYAPWRSKDEFELIKHLEPKYNRLVFFDGWKFQHGMNISNDRYFGEEYRKNQVFFFDCEEYLEDPDD